MLVASRSGCSKLNAVDSCNALKNAKPFPYRDGSGQGFKMGTLGHGFYHQDHDI